ncbi:MAG: hypothetical protein AAF714_03220 [Pseudomonadota bacterium]
MNGRLRIAATLSMLAVPLAAQEVAPCDWRASAAAVAEPWERNTATFARGMVRLALLDTVEPAAGAFHILVLSPPFDEIGTRQCRVISQGDSIGFAGADFASLRASYEASRGLTFRMDITRFDPATAGFEEAEIAFTVNQSTGAITVEDR